MDFKDKVVIVTGGGHGIGEAVAKAFASASAKVIIADMDREAADKVVKEIKKSAGEATSVETDIRFPDQITTLVNSAIDTYGKIDILINNAGVSRFKPVFDLTVEEWDDVINTNLRGTFLCAREAAKRMRENPNGGSIVNIASTRAFMSEKDSEAYAATKGGISALTHALSMSLSDDRITVNAISPGWIDTGDYQKLREIDHEQHPSKRVGKPDDIARTCLFLTNPENDFITGENIIVDGGMTRKMIYEH
ncbi:glucose 1-dehydrogenase [Sediminibacillus massiliensis]|uniref:glucose 1-dehydrogenase n=1 Tax=Sediminibacillus massiliensis TaxID=1926277 RepID=UPI0009889247|nr:glucose 1-dehydrogenase [Sediminibacillus massiliensis]